MNYEEFCQYVKNHIKEYLPVEYQPCRVILNEYSRKNRGTLVGLVMLAPGDIGGRAQYLENAYQAYSAGSDTAEIMSRLAAERLSLDKELDGYTQDELNVFRQRVTDFDEISDHILIEAIGFSRNRKLLSQVPHQVMGDIAAVYRIVLGEDNDMVTTVLINNKLLKIYEITPEQLHSIALVNTMRTRPASLNTMAGIAADIGIELDGSEQDIVTGSQMLVATNKQRVQGAAVVFYPKLWEKYGINPADYYMIPSSTHEIMMVPKTIMPLDEVNKTIKEVNESIVADSEILSDLAHEYDPISRKLVVGGSLQKERNVEKVIVFPSNSGRTR